METVGVLLKGTWVELKGMISDSLLSLPGKGSFGSFNACLKLACFGGGEGLALRPCNNCVLKSCDQWLAQPLHWLGSWVSHLSFLGLSFLLWGNSINGYPLCHSCGEHVPDRTLASIKIHIGRGFLHIINAEVGLLLVSSANDFNVPLWYFFSSAF